MQNLVPGDAMPYTTITGGEFDSGDYPEALRRAGDLIDLPAVRDRQKQREADGRLIGATRTDHGFVAISMFFDAPTDEEADRGVWQPGRITRSTDGHVFQDDVEYSDMCADRASNGYNSGMGEIFRRVAAITPVGQTEDAVGALL